MNALPSDFLQQQSPVKRSQCRNRLIFNLRVHDHDDGSLCGYLYNLNQRGSMLLSDHPFADREIYDLDIELPRRLREQLNGQDTLNVQAIKRWEEQGSDRAFSRAGFEFADLSEQDAQVLEALLDHYKH